MSASETGSPLTTIQAMAAGLPVIGARTGSLSERVDASRGMLVEAATPPRWSRRS
jgi:glycosyltransferase involved in cell wall biosynthesis